MITPQVVPAHLFCGLEGSDQSRPAASRGMDPGGRKERSSGRVDVSYRLGVKMIKHSNQRALQFLALCLRLRISCLRNLECKDHLFVYFIFSLLVLASTHYNLLICLSTLPDNEFFEGSGTISCLSPFLSPCPVCRLSLNGWLND